MTDETPTKTRTPRGLPVHNRPPRQLPDDAPAAAARAEFASRVQHLMASKGWSQSELARRAAQHMPPEFAVAG